jgi:DegT/DnrJ/EryC1/StrS aminotransferase family
VRLSALPPVRRAVPLQRGRPDARPSMERFFGNRSIALYASGTAALARAMAGCASRSHVKAPEVIIPAYGCPDLVAACVDACVQPRLVDVAAASWAYDPGALESTLSPATVAIVAVNLLGLGDGSAELIRLCNAKRIALIQDSAQYLPRESTDWPGEYVVLSFGRGKPLNLLHGGALIAPSASAGSLLAPPLRYTTRARLLSSRAAAMAFNALTHPMIYGILSALPGTGLGEVIYRPLGSAALLPGHAWPRVATAFELYREKPSYRRDVWTAALEDWSALGVVALTAPGAPLPTEPLRLALLAPDRAARDILVDNLSRAGLGASRFYATALPGVAGIPEAVKRQGPFPNASALADRLFTLPTHTLVNATTVRTAGAVLLAWQRARQGNAAS